MSDALTAPATADAPPPLDDVRRAEARGWPEGLLARARRAGLPEEIVSFFLAAKGVDAKWVEREVRALELIDERRLQVRELTARDKLALPELWRNAPEELGDWDVTVEREPNSIAQFLLQQNPSLTVIAAQGQLLACLGLSRREALVSGRLAEVTVRHSLRVRAERRSEGLGAIVRAFPPPALLHRPVLGEMAYVRTDNLLLMGFVNRLTPQFEFGSTAVSVVHLSAAAGQRRHDGVRRIARTDAATCAALINRTHGGRDLFRPLTEESLSLSLDQAARGASPPSAAPAFRWIHVYGWEDVWVVKRDGVVVACAGLWDRGRDVRERWVSRSTAEAREFAETNVLDFGFAEGAEAEMADLIDYLLAETLRLGRSAMVVPLEHLPTVRDELGEREGWVESRKLEWIPLAPDAPAGLDGAFTDLRYW